MDESSGWFLTRLFHSDFKTIIIPNEGSIEIGRDNKKSCIGISSEKFKHVSRKHCVIRCCDDRVSIIDRFSSGGTYIGDRRLSSAHPGEVVLKEGDMIGIGTHINDTDHFYKMNDHVLFYRVCRKAHPEEVITISDDEDVASDVKPVVADIFGDDEEIEIALPVSQTNNDQTEMQIPASSTNGCSTAVQCDVAGRGSSAIQSTISSVGSMRRESIFEAGMLVIPEDRLVELAPCTWEEEYDRMLRVARNADPPSDDEYSEQQYSQVLWQEIKQESVDVGDEYEPENVVTEEPVNDVFESEEENKFNRWKYKLDKRDPRIDVGKTKPKPEGRRTIILSEPEAIASGSKTHPPKRRKESVEQAVDPGPSKQNAHTAERKPASIPTRRPSVVEFDIFGEAHTPADPGHSKQNANTADRKTPGIPTRRPSVVEFDLFEETHTPAAKVIDPPKPDPSRKGIPKRRASVSLSEYNTQIQKKLKRRYSVTDRCPVKSATKAIDPAQKENRSKRLKEVADQWKQLSSTPTVEPVKTGSTKPRVKYTANNRGVFLTTPVTIQPKPASRSRPVVEGDMQVCTQSTTLEELRPDDDEAAAVVDVRPGKMTFKSVERLSNVDRPMSKTNLATKIPPTATAMGAPPKPKQASNLQQTHSKSAVSSTAVKPPRKSIASSSTSRTQPAHASNSSASLKPSSGSHTLQRHDGSSVPTGQIQGILKSPAGKSKRSIPKRVMFAEAHTTVVVPRYLQDRRVVSIPDNLHEILRQKEMTALSDVLGWQADWLEATVDDPFGETLLQVLENYPNLKTFRATLQPILMRELWQDVRSQYRCIRQPLPLTELTDVHAQEIPYRLCQITCKAFIRTKKKQVPWGNEIGVLYYASITKNRACRLLAYVSNRYREKSSNRASAPPDAGECFNVIMYAALSELEDLRSGSRFSFLPITTIMAHLRAVKALHLLEYSPLLPSILSPARNNCVRVAPGKAFVDEPELRDAIVARIEPGTLNQIQMDVVLSVLDECSRWQEPSISLIQGPPGTGKSRVISHLARELLYIEPRATRVKVLICAQSNTAVDVIAKRLMCLQRSREDPDDQFELLRIGTSDKVDDRCLDIFLDEKVKRNIDAENKRLGGKNTDYHMRDTYRSELKTLDNRIHQLEQDLASHPDANRSRLDDCYQRRTRLNELLSQTTAAIGYMSAEQRFALEKKIRFKLVDNADIVCTTLGSCAQLESYCHLANYDVCIIDEATQCTELYSLLPLMYGMPKMVLVGDINQLPATVLDQESIKAGFRQSLFSRLQDACGADKIKMLTVQYRMHPEISRWPNGYFYKRQLKNDPSTCDAARGACSLKPYLVVSLSYDQELTQIQHEIYNRDEIDFVVGLLKGIVQNCGKESSIAIITPYQRHKVEIMNQLRQSNLKQVQVHSIDSVQGKEYDVVIVSLARSNGAGFLNAPERINVALTRARKCLVLCGNFGCLRQKPVWKSLLEDAERRKLFVHTRGDTITNAIDSVMQRLVIKQCKQ